MPRRVALRVHHRPGSRAQRLEAYIQQLVTRQRGTPTSFARCAAVALGFPVRRQDVHKALINLGCVRKSYALIPGFSIPNERLQYLADMQRLACFANQILFTDEKKFKPEEFFSRFSNSGYAPRGQRLQPGFASSLFSSLFFTLLQRYVCCGNAMRMLSLHFSLSISSRLALPVRPSFRRAEVIGALGVVNPAPLLGDPQTIGDIGLVAYILEEPSLSAASITAFYTHTLPAITGRLPAPYSIVVLDNMGRHRGNEVAFRAALFATSLFIINNTHYSVFHTGNLRFWSSNHLVAPT